MNAAAAQSALARTGIALAPSPRWSEARLPAWYPALPGAAAAAWLLFGGEGEAALLSVLLVLLLPVFLQGIAVFAGLYERAKFARPVRMLGFVVLGVTEMFVPAVSLTGLADMWLNLRRLPRDGVAPRRPGPTPDGV